MKKIVMITFFLAINFLTFSQWQPEVRFTNDNYESLLSYNNSWCIAANGNTVHVVWGDQRNYPYQDIYYKRSIDGGITWESDTRLSFTSSASAFPSIALNGDNISLVYNSNCDGNWEIYYKLSTNAGLTWGADIRLTYNTYESRYPSLSVSGQFVHIVWYDKRDGNYEIYYKHSIDGGINWGADNRLTNDSQPSTNPSIATSGQNVHLVWHDERNNNHEIFYKSSSDGGLNWNADSSLTFADTYPSDNPSISLNGQYIYVVWNDSRDFNWEIYTKISTNAGISWGNDFRLTNNTSTQIYPSIAVSGPIIHIVWIDYRNGEYQTYYNHSTNNATNWCEDTQLTNFPAATSMASTAASGSSVHVVWARTIQNSAGNRSIFYERNPTGNLIPPVSPPLLISPVNNSQDQSLTPLLNWDTVLFAYNFRIQVSSDSTFGSTVFDTTISNSQITVPAGRLSNSLRYFWKVRGSNVLGDGPWSAIWNFRTIIAPPLLAPVLVTPLNNTSGHSLTPQLNWDTVFNTTLFQSQVSTESLFTAIVFDTAISLSEINVPAGKLVNNVKYFWRVRAINSGGNGPWSIIWNFTTALVGKLQNVNSEIPDSYSLYQNYPNPFNPTTKIRFEIPLSRGVDPIGRRGVLTLLIIYDILGCEVTTLVNEKLQPGTYEVDFDGSSLPSGVYFYKLSTGIFSAVNKMVLIK